ncbi:MAG: hypothetical protein PHV34_12025 [Verrucomicrobiae bacterium]|nr:hypothetical protein [Verrucomicrobiae bacterium]
MKIESLHIGMKVRHPQYGVGTVKAITEKTAEFVFPDGAKTIAPDSAELQPHEEQAEITGLSMPLAQFIEQVVKSTADRMGVEKPGETVDQLGNRWQNGRVTLHPSDSSLQPKEVPLEVFFHKIVMIRNNLRVLEQKINSHEKLSDADKVEMQQYITRSHGSLTTFNILFKNKQDQFSGA